MGCSNKVGPYACCSIVGGDSTDLLRLVPDGAVDAVITDPPFAVRNDKWDVFESEAAFYKFTETWMLEAYRASGCLASFFAERFLPLMYRIAAGNAIPVRRLLIWQKPPGSQFAGASQDGFWYDFEPVLVFGCPRAPRKKATAFSVLSHRTVTGQAHGCEKPVALISDLVRAYSSEGGIVLDPFVGSGTTAVAAKKWGRHYLGFERDPVNFQMAKKRLESAEADRTFESVNPAFVQAEFAK